MRSILDEHGRLLVVMNFNMDMAIPEHATIPSTPRR